MKTTYLFRSLAMEKLKIKNTWVPWLAVFAPAFVVVVAFVASYTGGDRVYKSGVNPWENFSGHVLIGWSLFVYPICISLQSALYAGIDHQNHSWGYLYSLPVPKWAVHLGKLILFVLLAGLSHVVLFVIAEWAGWLLGVLKPQYGFQNYSMHRVLLAASLVLFLTGLGMVVVQWFVSIYFQSFIIPVCAGLFATMAGAVSRGFAASNVSPYLWPTSLFNATLEMSKWDYNYVPVSIVFGIAGSLLGMAILSRRRS